MALLVVAGCGGSAGSCRLADGQHAFTAAFVGNVYSTPTCEPPSQSIVIHVEVRPQNWLVEETEADGGMRSFTATESGPSGCDRFATWIDESASIAQQDSLSSGRSDFALDHFTLTPAIDGGGGGFNYKGLCALRYRLDAQ